MQLAHSRPMYTDARLKDILTRTKVIAVVGVSLNPVRPSYYVARYLSLKGYRVIPVNPGHAGKMLFGESVQASLSDIEEEVDMVDIFRRPEAVPSHRGGGLDGVYGPADHLDADRRGACRGGSARRGPGVTVIQNRCPKIEYQRLFGELRQGGFATGIISSKL